MAVLHFYGLPEKLNLDVTRLCRFHLTCVLCAVDHKNIATYVGMCFCAKLD